MSDSPENFSQSLGEILAQVLNLHYKGQSLQKFQAAAKSAHQWEAAKSAYQWLASPEAGRWNYGPPCLTLGKITSM